MSDTSDYGDNNPYDAEVARMTQAQRDSSKPDKVADLVWLIRHEAEHARHGGPLATNLDEVVRGIIERADSYEILAQKGDYRLVSDPDCRWHIQCISTGAWYTEASGGLFDDSQTRGQYLALVKEHFPDYEDESDPDDPDNNVHDYSCGVCGAHVISQNVYQLGGPGKWDKACPACFYSKGDWK